MGYLLDIAKAAPPALPTADEVEPDIDGPVTGAEVAPQGPHLGAICRQARSYPHALTLLIDALGIPNGARLPEDFFDHADALTERWAASRETTTQHTDGA